MSRTIPREVKKEDIGWLAGIIDGEGSLVLASPKVKSTNQILCGVHIVNTNEELIDKCADIINLFDDGKGILLKRPKTYRVGAFKSNKKCYQLTIRRQGVIKNVLNAVLPHLTEKRLKAQKILNFLENHRCNSRFREGEVQEYLDFTPVETKRVALERDEAIVRTA